MALRAALLLAVVCFAGAHANARAAPSQKDADALLTRMRLVVDGGMSWGHKTQPQRIQVILEVDALLAQSQALFGDEAGPFAPCIRLAMGLQTHVQNLNTYARGVEGLGELNQVNALAPMQFAFGLGDSYRSCRNAIDGRLK